MIRDDINYHWKPEAVPKYVVTKDVAYIWSRCIAISGVLSIILASANSYEAGSIISHDPLMTIVSSVILTIIINNLYELLLPIQVQWFICIINFQGRII